AGPEPDADARAEERRPEPGGAARPGGADDLLLAELGQLPVDVVPCHSRVPSHIARAASDWPGAIPLATQIRRPRRATATPATLLPERPESAGSGSVTSQAWPSTSQSPHRAGRPDSAPALVTPDTTETVRAAGLRRLTTCSARKNPSPLPRSAYDAISSLPRTRRR